MIARPESANPMRTAGDDPKKLEKTAANRIAMMPMYPRLSARIRARWTAIRFPAATQSRTHGSPTQPLHTTTKAASARSWSGRGAALPAAS